MNGDSAFADPALLVVDDKHLHGTVWLAPSLL
jgi:hypothetical protein